MQNDAVLANQKKQYFKAALLTNITNLHSEWSCVHRACLFPYQMQPLQQWPNSYTQNYTAYIKCNTIPLLKHISQSLGSYVSRNWAKF